MDIKRSKKIIFPIIICLIFTGVIISFLNSQNKNIKIGFSGAWKTLNPSKQHTLFGDLVMVNIFDPLIGSDESGFPTPLLIKKWAFSNDYKTLNITIDSQKKYSNGLEISALDIKNCWEKSLQDDYYANNPSTLDVLYLLEGFNEFKKTGELSGIKVIDTHNLILKFQRPFRMAISHLQGVRYSPFKFENGKYIGTGHFEYKEFNENKIELSYSKAYDSSSDKSNVFTLLHFENGEIIDKLISGEIDVIAYMFAHQLSESILNNDKIGVLIGQEAGHNILQLNTSSNSIFHDVKMRKGLQYIFNDYIKKNFPVEWNKDFFRFDPQFYLPSSLGRISSEEAEEIIFTGKNFAVDLIEKTQKKPLSVYGWNIVALNALSSAGLNISFEKRDHETRDFFDVMYNSDDYDIVAGGASVSNSDPDGIYHKFGRTGAIKSKMITLPKLEELLEVGRSLIDRDDIDTHYRQVSKLLLEQAPVVHIGVVRSVALYRKDRVKIKSNTLKRNQGHIHIYESK